MIPRWRVRWTERENARRAAAYDAYLQVWQRADADLRASGDPRAAPIIAQHQQHRVGPPAKAEPQEAPATAWWTPARTTWISIVGGLLLLCLCGNVLSHVSG